MEQDKHQLKKINWSDPNTSGDYMYVNRNSKKIWPSLILYLLLGIAMFVFAWFRYQELRHWQQTGGQIKMYSFEGLCYDIAGIWLFPVLMAAVGAFLIWAGVQQFRRRQRQKG